MKMRGLFALILSLAFVSGCASGGGGGTASTTPTTVPAGSGGNLLVQGARPRETDNTDAAEEALEAAAEAEENQNAAAAQAQYQLALQASDAAIAEDPNNPLAYRLAGLSALGLDDYATAARHFDAAIERRPVYELELAATREDAYINLFGEAEPFLQSGEYLRAAEVLENAHTIYPRRAEAIITLSQIYAQERQHDRAIERIDTAMAFLESDAMADVDSATAAQWRADGENLLLMKGQVLADAGRFEEAVEVYRQIAAEDPNNIAVVQDMAAILMTMGREDEATQVYEQLLSRPGLESLDYYRIGVGFYNSQDYGRAADAFGRAAGASPRDRDAIEMWARSLQLDSAYTEVPAVVERWIELDPASQIALTVLAQATNLGGNPQGAAQIMRRVEALYATVDDLEMRRGPNAVVVSGSVANRTLSPGTRVTLNFTFYSNAGQPIGTATQSVTVQGVGEKQTFQTEFSTNQTVGGYGYTISQG